MPAPVDKWIICVSGFLGNEGHHGGIIRIQDDLWSECSGTNTRVLYKSWKDSPSAVANRIMHRKPKGQDPTIILVGHSYGGCTVNRIAWELKYRGIKVTALFLLDAVWRPYQAVPSITSLCRLCRIRVPDNVSILYSWSQRVNNPSGHKLIVPLSVEWHHEVVQVKHGFVDDLAGVRRKIYSIAI